MRRYLRSVPALLFALNVLAGCASGGERTRRDPNALTPEEIASVQALNMYEVVEQLRPRWLQVRAARSLTTATEVVVFMNRNLLGGPEVLRQFTPSTVSSIRYLDGPTAGATLSGLGGRAIEGAIVIEVSGGT